MNKLYTRTQQTCALLLIFAMLLIAPLSMPLFGQSPCTSPVVRQVSNAKATNSNVYDDITLAMTGLLGSGTEAAWVLDGATTFTENPDGTARLQGTVKQFGDYTTPRRLAMDITLGGKSYAPDASGPYNQTGVPTSSWYYYYSLTGSFTGLDALVGGKLNLAIHMHPFQVGIGANQMFTPEDQELNGAGGWFEWTIASQPTNGALQFTNYIPGLTISDIAILLSGTPAEPCIDPCATDAQAPTFTACPENITLSSTANCAIATWLAPIVTDNCSTPSVSSNYESGFCFPIGSTTVIYTATDAKGNKSTCSFIVTVTNPCDTDTQAPVLSTCPQNIALSSTTTCATATWTAPTATDNCSTPSVSSNYNSGFCFPIGSTTVIYTATDAKGNKSTCSFTVTVTNPCATDTQAPVFTACPTNITLSTTANCATATWTAPKATDNCSTPIVTSNYNSGFCFPVGTTTVTYTATDAKGNNVVCSFTVKVTKTISCTVTGNTLTKTCVNNIPVIAGSAFTNYEYVWLKSTTGCPTQASQAIAGATAQNYTLPSRVSVTTYFVRCARPIGCTTWGPVNESNCVTVYATDCAPVNCTITGNTLTKTCVNNIPVIAGSAFTNYEYVWLKSTTGCPNQASQAIAGATAQNYTLPSRVSVTTYFVRCARPIGCTTWGPVNESNCVTVYATDCAPAPATCDINFSSTKSYRIVSKKSGKALDIYGNGMGNDVPVIQWGYHGGANQQWRLFSLGSGYFKVMARSSSKYLACHYTANGTAVYQYDYYTGGYKDWKIECVGTTGYYRFVHRASGKVLDLSGASMADGAKMEIFTWDGTDSQLFKIEEVAPAAYSVAASTVLALNASSESDRVRLGWLTNTGYDNDFYTVEKMNPSTGDFEKMTLVNNTQFDDQVQTHVAFDANPTEGDNFYRVKVSMNNGQDRLTDVKKVTFKRMVGFGAFPNPASDELNVNLAEYTGKSVDIVIYNSFGKVMSRERMENVANSVHKLNVNELSAGQYMIRVSSEGKRDATQPVVIQK